MKLRAQRGFTIVEFIIIAAILGVVGFVGYSVYDRQQNKATPKTAEVSDVPAIKDSADLTSAEATLEQTDPQTSNNADTAELDENLNSF